MLPLWIPVGFEAPPPLCGSIAPRPSYIAKRGDLVVAKNPKYIEDQWFMAEVVDFYDGKYDVEHLNSEDSTRCYRIEKKHVHPLPLMRADPKTCPHAFFRRNQPVLALKPYTSVFEKAIVKTPPQFYYEPYEVLFKSEKDLHYSVHMMVPQFFMTHFPRP